jgi:hypothetical protein
MNTHPVDRRNFLLTVAASVQARKVLRRMGT